MSNLKTVKTVRAMAALAVLAGPMTAAMATNGYFSHGYGIKAKGMGGASVTMTDNAFGGANNPAAAAWADNRLDLGVDLFSPNRSMTRTNSAGGFGDASVKSDKNIFVVPEIGFNRAVNDKLGVGVTVYGRRPEHRLRRWPAQLRPGACQCSVWFGSTRCRSGPAHRSADGGLQDQ